MPTLFTDVDGRYRGADDAIHQANGWTYYTDFSLWDTYRTLHPLVQLIWPELGLDYARSLVDMAEKRGGFPTWPQGVGDSGSMLGNAAELVVAETFAKGIEDFDAESAFELADRQGSDPTSSRARDDLAVYLDYGYVPSDLAGESVAKTLEYAIDDTAMALFAEALGKKEQVDRYTQRAAQTRQVFDSETGFHRGKLASGEWDDLQEFGWGDHYTEGNAWQYAWLVPHDAKGLATSFGGSEALFEKLDTFMDRGTDDVPDFVPPDYYWHGNEPDLHAAFLYAQLGRPTATQKWVRWIQENRYDTAPAGYSGNDDGGTLAAWYVFSAMGLYPLNGTDRYVLFQPLFEAIRIHRPDGDLDIRVGTEAAETAGYQHKGEHELIITLGDQALGHPTLSHGELLYAGELLFELEP
jgi:predicted alpha-1,2-mannosidase